MDNFIKYYITFVDQLLNVNKSNADTNLDQCTKELPLKGPGTKVLITYHANIQTHFEWLYIFNVFFSLGLFQNI